MKITPTSLNIFQLLGAKNEQYVIPAYQRRYSWKRQQVEDLWDDLQVLEGNDSHLFGTIVCLTSPHTAGINRLELVDGQQRLTTISILLHCLLARLQKESENSEAQELMGLLTAKALGGEAQAKIQLDSLDAKQFRDHAAGEFAEVVPNVRLQEAFELLKERIGSLTLEEVGVVLYRLKNQAIIIRLDVSEAKDAFKLFETINNRGLRLSATDIIKNFLLGNAARFSAGSLDLARERWAQLLLELDGIALDTFFRQYMMAHLRRRVTKSEVVEEFQKTFMREIAEAEALPDRRHYAEPDDADDDADDDVLENGAVTADEAGEVDDDDVASSGEPRISFSAFLQQLVGLARVYRQLVLADTAVPGIDRRLRNLRLIRAQQSYGFLMSLRASGCGDKDFEEVLRLTEAFLLRRHTTRERTNENETVFAQLCSIDASQPIAAVRSLYREYYPSDERFKQEFAAAVFPSRLIDRARYCLEQFEMAEQGGHVELLPAGPDLVHIEHIIPQKIKTKKAKNRFGDWISYLGPQALQQHPRYVARIGNLTLFSGELNISASNNPYHRKRGAHAQSNFKLTSVLPDEYPEFGFAEVETRSERLAERALKVWPAM